MAHKKLILSELSRGYRHRRKCLLELGFQSYKEYLRSEMWETIRSIVLADRPKCEACHKSRATQVHHSCYTIDVLIGKRPDLLVSVCRRCHESAEIGPDGDKRLLTQANKSLGIKCVSVGKLMRRERDILRYGTERVMRWDERKRDSNRRRMIRRAAFVRIASQIKAIAAPRTGSEGG